MTLIIFDYLGSLIQDIVTMDRPFSVKLRNLWDFNLIVFFLVFIHSVFFLSLINSGLISLPTPRFVGW